MRVVRRVKLPKTVTSRVCEKLSARKTNTSKKQSNMKKYLANAFSLQMLEALPAVIKVREAKEEEIFSVAADGSKNLVNGIVSVIGHEDTARVLGVPFNRISVKFKDGDIIYVAQLQGGRLPEGATTLPEGFKFKYIKVTL